MINNSTHGEVEEAKKKKKNDRVSAGDVVYRRFSCSIAYDTYAFHFCYHLTNCDCRLTERHFFFDYTQTKIDTVIDVVVLLTKQKKSRTMKWFYDIDFVSYHHSK